MTATDPRYPIGRFTYEHPLADAERAAAIEAITQAPWLLREAVAGLDDAQLDTPYREGGWTVRQVVHHVPDSHLNAYTRFKLALTEERPTVRPYDEAAWAELPDGRTGSIDVSLALLEALHERWVRTLQAMAPGDFARTIYHPEHAKEMSLDQLLAMYAWHGRHHVAHVTELRRRKGW
ncbi:MAG TPA: putative metal-dependent hydrolase [Gemmatimonadales bacterium]|nr:putative metal-dependent hydrolase [Gemmatimonadales bacterium]